MLVLGFRPDAEAVRAELPESIYHMRSVDEVEKMLCETGFEIARVAEQSPTFTCVIARAAG